MNAQDLYLERPIKLFFYKGSPLRDLPSLYADYLYETTDRDAADFIVLASNYSNINKLDLNDIEKMVVFLNVSGKERTSVGSNIRRGEFVDELGLSEKTSSILRRAALVFTTADLDYDRHNFVGVPLGFNEFENISQPKLYWQEELELPAERNRKIYWSGSVWTHESRVLIDKLNQLGDEMFSLHSWVPKSVDGKDASVYNKMQPKPRPQEYENFIKHLLESEAAFVIRGDRPWVFSFLDVMRAGCIPCLVNTAYDRLGWDSLGYETENLFLNFDTSSDSLDVITATLRALLDDEQKMRDMRRNIVSFYRRFIITDKYYTNSRFHRLLTGWGDFYVAKLIERKQGNFDNKFFTKTVLGLKGVA